jgi:methionine-rich copper-binding protein CopC
LFSLLFATPAAAHAELVNISPANGAQLKTPPTQVQLTEWRDRAGSRS